MEIKLFKDIKLPTKSHLPDVGLDLYMPESFDLQPFETKTIGLGLGVQIPEGFAGMIVPRSSISMQGLIIQTSVIDPDYTWEIHLIITNCSNNHVSIMKDQRICSLVIYSVLNARIELVKEFKKTCRQNDGLGSTGKF